MQAVTKILCLVILCGGASCFYIDNSGSDKKDKIIGGLYVDIKQAPYIAQLIRHGTQVCGGSILSEHWILTASHCLDKTDGLSIKTGSSEPGVGGENHKITKIITHKDYDDDIFLNDIALIKVAKPIQFNAVQKPIKISTKPPKTGEQMRVSGWGSEGEGNIESEFLKIAVVPVIDHEECENIYTDTEFEITRKMFCAGVGKTDTCQGDSGGPAVINHTLVGVTSYGMECADEYYPGVYTSVYAYRRWIAKNTGLIL